MYLPKRDCVTNHKRTLKEEAEKAKIALSSAQTYDVNLPFITARMEGGATVIIPNVLSFLAEVGRWDRMMFTEFCLEPEEDNYDGFSVEDEFSDSELEDY